MAEQQQPPDWKPGEVRVSDDAHGRVYTTRCPQCGRQQSERSAGEVRCSCGKLLDLGR